MEPVNNLTKQEKKDLFILVRTLNEKSTDHYPLIEDYNKIVDVRDLFNRPALSRDTVFRELENLDLIDQDDPVWRAIKALTNIQN